MNTGPGGLRLPATISGAGADQEEAIHNDWDTYDEAARFVEMELGLPPLTEPGYSPPTLELGDLEATGKDYSEKYLMFLGWFNYAQQEENKAACKVLQIDNEMKQIAAKMREGMRERSPKTTKAGEKKAPPAAEMDDRLRLDPRYLELGQQLQFNQHVRKLIESKRETYESSMKLLSRNIEIKRMEFEGTNRENAIRGQRGAPTGQPQRGMRNPG